MGFLSIKPVTGFDKAGRVWKRYQTSGCELTSLVIGRGGWTSHQVSSRGKLAQKETLFTMNGLLIGGHIGRAWSQARVQC